MMTFDVEHGALYGSIFISFISYLSHPPSGYPSYLTPPAPVAPAPPPLPSAPSNDPRSSSIAALRMKAKEHVENLSKGLQMV